MPVLFSYLIKLSVSLAVVFLFYQLVLRRLTFYNWNRWYLLGYTFISFFIPFIDITAVLEKNDLTTNEMIIWVPALTVQFTSSGDPVHTSTIWNGVLFVFGIGILLMLLRLLIQLVSFYRMKRKAIPVAENSLNIFHVNENIIPFSFGNSIFINRNLHSETELEEIIRHEFIHVKQKHSLDIIWGELLCMINWYNPFAWLLKRSIRQNLEFIADNKVIENGINKKEYQYLLLKVIGNTQFSIAAQFNFSSLKKRIAMMNKTKSAKRQVSRFLFLLPVLAIILLSFRKSFNDTFHVKTGMRSLVFTDTVPEVTEPNSKGYFIDVKGNKGQCTIVVKDKNKKEVKRLLLTEWNEKADYYEGLYGEIPPPPKPAKPLQPANPTQPAQPASPAAPKNNTGEFVVEDDKVTVTLKDGKSEVYNLKNDKEKKEFIDKYDRPVLTEAITPTTIVNPALEAKINAINTTALKKSIVGNINPVITPVITNENLNTNITSVITNANLNANIAPTLAVEAKLAATTINPVVATNLKNKIENVVVPNEALGATISGVNNARNVLENADVVATIKKTTTPEELELLVKKFKEYGYELKFTTKNYNDGILTELSGTIKYKDSNGSFSFSDFEQGTIAVFREGDHVSFKVFTGKNRVVL